MESRDVRSWKSKCEGCERADLRARMESWWASSLEASSLGMVRRARRR